MRQVNQPSVPPGIQSLAGGGGGSSCHLRTLLQESLEKGGSCKHLAPTLRAAGGQGHQPGRGSGQGTSVQHTQSASIYWVFIVSQAVSGSRASAAPTSLSPSLSTGASVNPLFRLSPTTPSQTFPQSKAHQTLLLIRVYFQIQPHFNRNSSYMPPSYGEIYVQGNWELVHTLLGPQCLIQLGPIPSVDVAAVIPGGNRIKPRPQFACPLCSIPLRACSPLPKM